MRELRVAPWRRGRYRRSGLSSMPSHSRPRRSETDHVGGGQSADVVDVSCDAEIGQQDSPLFFVVDVGEHDVGGFGVAVQQTLFVGVVQGI